MAKSEASTVKYKKTIDFSSPDDTWYANPTQSARPDYALLRGTRNQLDFRPRQVQVPVPGPIVFDVTVILQSALGYTVREIERRSIFFRSR